MIPARSASLVLALLFQAGVSETYAAGPPATQPSELTGVRGDGNLPGVEQPRVSGDFQLPEGDASKAVTIRLEYRPVEGPANPILNTARRQLVLQKQPPPSLKTPARLDSRLQCYTVKLGDKEVLVLIEDNIPPRLCIDTNFNGNLAEERRVVGRPVPNPDGAGASGRFRFGPVSCGIANGPMQIFIEGNAKQGFEVIPARYREGSLDQDGRTYRVALVDRDYDGRFDRAISPSSKPPFSEMSDWVAIDQNRNGRFDLVSSGRWEIQPLTPVLAFGNAYYRAEVQPDGSAITLRPIALRSGTLQIGAPDSELVVIGLSGIFQLAGVNGKWSLPEGPYHYVSVRIWHTDGRTKEIWELMDTGNTPAVRDFHVDADRRLTLPVGSTLAVKDSDSGVQTPVDNARLAVGSLVVDKARVEYKVVEGSKSSLNEPLPDRVAGGYQAWPGPMMQYAPPPVFVPNLNPAVGGYQGPPGSTIQYARAPVYVPNPFAGQDQRVTRPTMMRLRSQPMIMPLRGDYDSCTHSLVRSSYRPIYRPRG